MSDQPEPTTQLDIADPHVREAIAAVVRPIIVIGVEDVPTLYDTDLLSLGEDHDKWLAFIDDAVGGGGEAVIRYRASRRAYYLNDEAYQRGSVAEFNPVATLMSAHDMGVQFKQAQPLFGPVVLTGFNLRTYLPCPLDQEQHLAFLAALDTNELLAQAELEHLQESEDRSPGSEAA
jgi:hypothetical protein